MSLYVHSTGQGPALVLLHGWGMNAEVWLDMIAGLKENYRLISIDLPGYGRSKAVKCNYSLDGLLDVLLPCLPGKSHILGWSLGGLIAQAIAFKHAQRVDKLVLLASNAQFQQTTDWPYAMQPAVLNGFMQNLEKDYKQTLQQFLMLQALGAENAKQTICELKQRLFIHGKPDTAALKGGLLLLQNASMVDALSQISCPTLLINGKLDGLVPVSAGQQMQQLLPDAQLKVLDKAAHAPFISHADLCIKYLTEFLN